MPLLKLLFTLAVFYYASKWLWRLILSVPAGPQQTGSQGYSGTQSPKKEGRIMIGQMLACATCGTYVAENQVVTREGQTFCSERCVGAGRAQ